MIITTGEIVPGHQISEILGPVIGNTVRAKLPGANIVVGLKSLVGGKMDGYREKVSVARQDALSEARQDAQGRMASQARLLGADAVIVTRFTTSSVNEGLSELLVFGTAVKLARTPD